MYRAVEKLFALLQLFSDNRNDLSYLIEVTIILIVLPGASLPEALRSPLTAKKALCLTAAVAHT